MSSPQTPPANRLWMVVLLLAVGTVVLVDWPRLARLQRVAALIHGEASADAASPTGYAGGVRDRVLPDHDGNSYAWLAQTQTMAATGAWRIRSVTEENAPFGRSEHAAAPYRWWLRAVAMIHQHATGVSTGLAIERAAAYADPLLHLLLLVTGTVLLARWGGAPAAALFAAGAATFFPFVAVFLPGAPDDLTLQVIAAVTGVLSLLLGARAAAVSREATSRRAFAFAGVCGGVGLWLSPSTGVPVLAGIGLGAMVSAWTQRQRRPAASPPPWRVWSVSGGVTVLGASLVEYFPHHLGDWELRAIHPLYGLAWLGAGELLARSCHAIASGWTRPRGRACLTGTAAALAFATVPVLMYRLGNPGFLAADVLAFRLTREPGTAFAPHVLAWLRADGASLTTLAILAPLLLLGAALPAIVRRHEAAGRLALAAGPVLVAGAIACFQLRWWGIAAGLALTLPVAAALGEFRQTKWGWILATGVVGAAGILRQLPTLRPQQGNALTFGEAQGLMERDLAHWLARHADGPDRPIVLAPPDLTTTLNYYGGLRGLGARSWESTEGVAFAVRVTISTSRDESLALLRRRSVNYLVLPSWDPFFENYSRASSMQVGELFYRSLTRWALPPWLRPIPYQPPRIPGLEQHDVRIYQVVEDQGEPLAAARLTEYFIEMNQLENARATRPLLARFPADLGVLVARAQLEGALGEADALGKSLDALLSRLAAGADRSLGWERRVSLATVLARGDRPDAARAQLQRCVAEANDARLRTLTTNSLYYLLLLKKNFGLEFADPRLQALALSLLSEEQRQGL